MALTNNDCNYYHKNYNFTTFAPRKTKYNFKYII